MQQTIYYFNYCKVIYLKIFIQHLIYRSSTVSQPAGYVNSHTYELAREPASTTTIDTEVQPQPPSYSQIFNNDPAHPPPEAPNAKQLYPKQQHTMFLASGLVDSNASATGRAGQLPPLMGPSAGVPPQSNSGQSLPPIRGTIKSPNYNP